ncbi:MAG TPA: ABC transporter ATP-binding protein [Verrucomicrobiae bacterium]|nr:ABC transporter ATP-binding protein [Verrucomicrobiae bacterium]
MLSIQNLSVNYGAIAALHGISLEVETGDIVTLIGANGAGKTTTLRAISGLVKAGGQILYEGRDLTNLPPHKIVAAGISHVPEGRMIFANLTVSENLDMGAYMQKSRASIQSDREFVFGMFPRLAERQKQVAGTLSGGEQQMLAIGRALMSKPKVLMLDEPSLGIAPILVQTIFEKIVEINRQRGVTILLVEQNANLALEISRFGCVLETGRIILRDTSAALRQNPKVREAYLGG